MIRLALIYILFASTLFGNLYAQESNDCVNAIVICGNSSFNSNVQGPGNIQEVSGCGGQENNSIWLEINIAQNGTLGFDIIPENTNLVVDYDFWVFGPNLSCGNLGSPIRCSTTNPTQANTPNNHTGMNEDAMDTNEGPGPMGNSYVKSIDVIEGETYFVVIDRFDGDEGFNLNWTGSATQGDGAFPEPPVANAIEDIQQCSEDGTGIFDLNSLRNTITPNSSDNEIAFYENLADATDEVNALSDQYESTVPSQHIVAKVTDPVTRCSNLTEFDVLLVGIQDVNLRASATTICTPRNVEFSFESNPGATLTYQVDGGPAQTTVLDEQGAGTLSMMIDNATTITVIKAEVFDGQGNLLCSENMDNSVSVLFESIMIGSDLKDFKVCDGNKDDVAKFDLFENINLAKANVIDDNYNVEFYKNETDAVNRVNAIEEISSFEASGFPKTIWVRLEENGFPDCYDIGTFKLDVYTDAPPSFQVTKRNTEIDAEHQVVISNIEGIGPYEFSVDNGNWKPAIDGESLTFDIPGGGEHIITGRHSEGCGQKSKSVVFLDYPNYFTPNGDGFNEFWNVLGAEEIRIEGEILIYDRYGKLLTGINPRGKGWDGTYNGKPLPGNDYWFLLKYKQMGADGQAIQKEFKAHFTLLR